MFSTLQITSRDQGVLFVESFEQRIYGRSPQTDAEADAQALALAQAPARTQTPRRAPFWQALAAPFAFYPVAR